MTTQEQALRSYYASMTDAELLATASNKGSFIAAAQHLLSEELARRNLSVAPAAPHEPAHSEPSLGLAKVAGRLRHAFHH